MCASRIIRRLKDSGFDSDLLDLDFDLRRLPHGIRVSVDRALPLSEHGELASPLMMPICLYIATSRMEENITQNSGVLPVAKITEAKLEHFRYCGQEPAPWYYIPSA